MKRLIAYILPFILVFSWATVVLSDGFMGGGGGTPDPVDTTVDSIRAYKSGTGQMWATGGTHTENPYKIPISIINPSSSLPICFPVQYAMANVTFSAMNNNGTSIVVDLLKCGTTNCQSCVSMLSSKVTSSTNPAVASMASTTIGANELVSVQTYTNTGSVSSVSCLITGTASNVQSF
jgi:hypothetical protein